MGYGLGIRMKRMCEENGRMFIVPLDHGITLGALQGLINIESTVQQVLAGGANGVVVHKGIARRIAPYIDKGKVLGIHLNASTSLGKGNNGKSKVCDVEEAVRYGADFISYHINLGNEYEMVQLKELGQIKRECEKLGFPLLVMSYVRNNEGDITKGKMIAHAVRVVEEVGADIIKCSAPKENSDIEKIVKSVRTPVLFSGGVMKASVNELYSSILEEIQLGASGVMIGRNVFGSKNPQEVSAVIHSIIIDKIQDKKLWG